MDIKTIDGKAPGANEDTAFTIGFKMPVRPIDANALDLKDFWAVYGTEVWESELREWISEQPTLSLNTLRDAIYEDAVAHGLWEGAELAVAVECAQRGSEWKENLLRSAGAQKIWDEALELDKAWKNPEHYAEELADVIIMSMSVAGKMGIDIAAAIRRKMEINKQRMRPA